MGLFSRKQHTTMESLVISIMPLDHFGRYHTYEAASELFTSAGTRLRTTVSSIYGSKTSVVSEDSSDGFEWVIHGDNITGRYSALPMQLKPREPVHSYPTCYECTLTVQQPHLDWVRAGKLVQSLQWQRFVLARDWGKISEAPFWYNVNDDVKEMGNELLERLGLNNPKMITYVVMNDRVFWECYAERKT